MPSAGIMASAVVPPATGIAVAATSTEVGTAIGATPPANSIPNPAGAGAGDLLLAFVCVDQNFGGIEASTGWTILVDGARTGLTWHLLARVATGAGADTLSIGAGSFPSSDYCAAILRITGHTVTNVATDILYTQVSSSGSTTPDPGSIFISGTRTSLWLAMCCVDRNAGETITAVPASYTEVINIVSSAEATSNTLGVASRVLTTINQSENPGTFTITASRQWGTFTVAVP